MVGHDDEVGRTGSESGEHRPLDQRSLPVSDPGCDGRDERVRPGSTALTESSPFRQAWRMVPKRYMSAHLTSMGTDHDLTSRFELEQGSGILDAPGEVWLTLARLEATRLQVPIRDLSGRA